MKKAKPYIKVILLILILICIDQLLKAFVPEECIVIPRNFEVYCYEKYWGCF